MRAVRESASRAGKSRPALPGSHTAPRDVICDNFVALKVLKVVILTDSDACLLQVGNEFIRGISGGERKRTNIGMELIMSPPVLFLDEPTTGLDASTAVSVVQLLQG